VGVTVLRRAPYRKLNGTVRVTVLSRARCREEYGTVHDFSRVSYVRSVSGR
jgi:hypothetical protein